MKKAAALRMKYRRAGGSVVLSCDMVGFHPFNRDGQAPNGERCRALLAEILQFGFDAAEANHEGVAVADEPGSSYIHDFNFKACEADELLALVVAAKCIRVGSLSHSHLHQVLRNVRAGVKCGLPGVCTADASLSLELLRSVDEAFAVAADSGLRWEVLEPAMLREEPEAAITIQSALHSKKQYFHAGA